MIPVLVYRQSKVQLEVANAMAESEAGRRRNRRLGRPPGPPEAVRRRRVVTLLTDAEFKELTRIAEAEKESVSALVHRIIARFLARHR